MCDWYVEFTKPILNGDHAHVKTETRHTLAWVLGQFCHLLHPIMPFITEEIWQALQGEGLLVKSPWLIVEPINFQKAQQEVKFVIDLISTLRSLRAELRILPGYLLEISWAEGPKELQEVLRLHQDMIHE